MRILAGTMGVILLSIPVHAQTVKTPVACEALSSLKLANTTIALATSVPAGTLRLSAGGPVAADLVLNDLPAFCRVSATLKPSPDSDINIEVWMPTSGWNGKFQAVGNGGWAGTIAYATPIPRSLATALRRGYATAGTDTGHTGNSGSFALGHPEKLIDFGHRAVHDMTVAAKAIIAAYYGGGPRLSYWNGCSNGGRQGLMEAQRYPADYDGILAGAPGNYWTRMVTSSLWIAHASLKDRTNYLPPEKYPALHKAVLDACDARDGVSDGVLENPRSCRFDPRVLQCSAGDAATCLTASQIDTAHKIYGPVTNPRTGATLFPGLQPGSEMGWARLAGGPDPDSAPVDHFKYIVFKNPDWDYRTLNFDTDVTLADQIDGGTINAIDPDIGPFVSRGGKLLMYHGWNDPLIPPENTISYYTSVVDRLGVERISSSVRLFMLPGVNHCGGGDGPSDFDGIAALDRWVEQKTPPQRIPASQLTDGKIGRTRPLCPYPQVARYRGKGSTDEAANFACSAN